MLDQALLLSKTPADHDSARDMIAALITQHRGEYVLRIGEQPLHTHLFAGDLSEDSGDWSGIPRTEGELDLLRDAITKTVEEVGGKVRRPFCSKLRYLLTEVSDISSFRDADTTSPDILASEITPTQRVPDS